VIGVVLDIRRCDGCGVLMDARKLLPLAWSHVRVYWWCAACRGRNRRESWQAVRRARLT
jgi:hypothetical protein